MGDKVMATSGECWMLLSSFVCAVDTALSDGERSHEPLEWLNKTTINEHLEHAHNHIVECIDAAKRFSDEIALDHAICRLVMAKTLLIQRKIIKEQGS